MTTIPEPPPIPGDHRETWRAITIVVVLVLAALATAVAVMPK